MGNSSLIGRLLQDQYGRLKQNPDGTLLQAKVQQGTGDPYLTGTESGSCQCCCVCNSAGNAFNPSLPVTIGDFDESLAGVALIDFFNIGSPNTFTFGSLPVNDTFCVKMITQSHSNCLYRALIPGASVSWTALGGGSASTLYLEVLVMWDGFQVNAVLQIYFPDALAAIGPQAIIAGNTGAGLFPPFSAPGVPLTGLFTDDGMVHTWVCGGTTHTWESAVDGYTATYEDTVGNVYRPGGNYAATDALC